MADLTPQQIADFIAVWTAWGVSVDQFNAWGMGGAGGGPNNDGRYPLTNRAGVEVLVPCPARIASLVPTGQPIDLIVQCFADQAMVRTGTRIATMRAPRALTVTGLRASLTVADLSPAETGGLVIDVKANGASILSAPLRIRAGQLSSLAAGTQQPVIATSQIADDAEITVDVLAEGVGARGLRVMLKGNYA